jgi:hypothetical protein
MKTEANKVYRPVLWRMIIGHFNNKLIAYVNTEITPCPKSSQSQSRPITGTVRTFTKSVPREDHRGVDLISEALPFGRLTTANVGWDHRCGSLSVRLLNPVESERTQASSAVAALNETPSVQSVMSVSASRDVLQRIQVPNFDA